MMQKCFGDTTVAIYFHLDDSTIEIMNILFMLTHCPEIKNIGSNTQKYLAYNEAVFNGFSGI